MRSAPRFLFALALVAPAAVAQQSDVERVIALGKSDNHVMEHLDHLANRIGPRLTGSDNLSNACAWARSQFEKFGLSNARLEKWGEFPVGFDRGPSSGHMLAPEVKELHFNTNAWTAGTKGPTTGIAILAPTNDAELEAVRAKLPGAWIVVPTATRAAPRRPANDAPVADAKGDASHPANAAAPTGADAKKSDSPAPSAEERRATARADREFREKLDKAYDEAGIAGTIRSGRGDLLLTDGTSKIKFDKLPTRPSIQLLAKEHKDLVERLKNGEQVSLQFDIRNWFIEGPIDLYNVIAELPGTEKPDEYVIVGGHIDSWDGATGATDNGTGVSTTLEVARLLSAAHVHPKRTIRFMLWSGEEQGLLGSRAWVKAHKDEMPKISAVLVHDEGTNYCAAIPATAEMVPLFEPIFAPVKDLDPDMPFKVHEVKGLPGGGSDHDSFLAQNVPGIFWEQKGSTSYNHVHHTQFDTYDFAVPKYQQNSSIVIAVGALGIANLPDLLPRDHLRQQGGGGFGGRRLGVQLGEEMAIDEIVEGGLAEKAKLQVGDKILKIGDKTVADATELREAMQAAPQKTTVTVQRAGQSITAEIEFPAESASNRGPSGRIGMRVGEELAIESITEGSAAEKAGLKVGDKVVKVGDTKIDDASELFGALRDASGTVKVVVMREGKELVVSLTMPERP